MNTEFIAGRPGYTFKNGKLYSFNNRRVLVLSAGNDPRCWVKTQGNPCWHSSRKAMNDIMRCLPVCLDEPTDIIGKSGKYFVQVNGQMVEPYAVQYLQREALEIQRYQHKIPPEILERICRFSKHRWQLYNLLARVPGAIDLCDSNPALAYMLASNWIFHKPSVKNHLRAARALVNKKQSHILAWLGFDGKKSVRRIMQKIQPASVNVRQLFYLRGGLANAETRKLLSHVSSINCGVLRLATDVEFIPHITPSLLEEIGTVNDRPDNLGSYAVVQQLQDVVRMAHLTGWKYVPSKFQTLGQLDKIHDCLARENYLANLPEALPKPPFAGTDSILPIQTVEDLQKEADEQENCVASYAEAIQLGHHYIYRVLAPVRATLGIRKRWNTNKWIVFELSASKNASIPAETQSSIKNALFQSKAA